MLKPACTLCLADSTGALKRICCRCSLHAQEWSRPSSTTDAVLVVRAEASAAKGCEQLAVASPGSTFQYLPLCLLALQTGVHRCWSCDGVSGTPGSLWAGYARIMLVPTHARAQAAPRRLAEASGPCGTAAGAVLYTPAARAHFAAGEHQQHQHKLLVACVSERALTRRILQVSAEASVPSPGNGEVLEPDKPEPLDPPPEGPGAVRPCPEL